MKRNDLYLVLAVLFIAALIFAGLRLYKGAKGDTESSASVSISVDGEEKEVLPLSEDTSLRVEGKSSNSLIVHIEGGEVWVTDATCPDKICVHQGRVRNQGEMIVCMPSRIVVEII
ncbi:MAG: NusG domain II-containing protein [Lachnospiraceae bacterium]|nr:NusG domain II-containing protein [Lachnospiraceae bacterium]MBR2276119.1 NusG domain II-containing protein [Lachnospiraceae bacterium]